MSLSHQEIILIAVILGAVGLILSNRLRSDLVALMALLALAVTGVITPEEAFQGFSRSVIFTLIGLFIISHALEETGVVAWMAGRLQNLSGGKENRLILITMLAGASLALVMNIIAAGAVLLPVVIQAARDSNIRASKVLIPLSYATLLGGTATIFATANIILSGILEDQGLQGLGFTDFFQTGSLLLIAGIGYMIFIGRRLLPDRDSASSAQSLRGSPATLAQNLHNAYQLKDRLWEMEILPGSRLINSTLARANIGQLFGLTVLAIWRGHQAILTPEPDEVFRRGDFLLVLGREERAREFATWGKLTIGRDDGAAGHIPLHDYAVDLTEVIIPPRSNIVGKTLTELRFRSKYRLTTVALWRGGRSYRTDVGKMPLEVGDALLMVGSAQNIRLLQQERDFLVLQSSQLAKPPLPQKAKYAVAITTIVVLMSIFNILPTAEAMLLGAVGMVLSGCLDMDEAYRGISWRVIFLIAGMLPISLALVNTGLAARIGGALVGVVAPFGGLALIAAMFLFTVAFVQVLSGQVTAVIVGPIAVSAALQMGIDPQAIAVATATACSIGFLTPTAHPVNTLMMAPGGYVPKDFARVGGGLTVITFAILMLGMFVFWGVR